MIRASGNDEARQTIEPDKSGHYKHMQDSFASKQKATLLQQTFQVNLN